MSARALLLLGSPRPAGASAALGGFLLERLRRPGLDTDCLALTGLLETREGRTRLASAVDAARLVILAAPVYADCLPAPVVRAMEFLAEPPASGDPSRLFAAVIVCGFPEASHTESALDICRLFARQAGLAWAGGLGVGGAGALGGKSLAGAGRIGANIRQALDRAAEALARGLPVPAEARELAARPLMPTRLYLALAEFDFLRQAVRHRALFKLGQTPYRTP